MQILWFEIRVESLCCFSVYGYLRWWQKHLGSTIDNWNRFLKAVGDEGWGMRDVRDIQLVLLRRLDPSSAIWLRFWKQNTWKINRANLRILKKDNNQGLLIDVLFCIHLNLHPQKIHNLPLWQFQANPWFFPRHSQPAVKNPNRMSSGRESTQAIAVRHSRRHPQKKRSGRVPKYKLSVHWKKLPFFFFAWFTMVNHQDFFCTCRAQHHGCLEAFAT